MPPHSDYGPRMPGQRKSRIYNSVSSDVSCGSRSKMIFTRLMSCRSSSHHQGGASLGSAREILVSKEKKDLNEGSQSERKQDKTAGEVWDSLAEDTQALNDALVKLGKVQQDQDSEGIAGVQNGEIAAEFEGEMENGPLGSFEPVAKVSDTKTTESKHNRDHGTLHALDLVEQGQDWRQEYQMKSKCDLKEVHRKVQTLNQLQKLVIQLQFGNEGEQWVAAAEVRRLAKDDPQARVTLAMLGAIPPLICILDSPRPKFQSSALLALLNLATGNELNKAAIVKARAIPKMVKLLQSPHVGVQEAVVTAFLSLSALDVNKPVIGASGAVSMLVDFVGSGSSQGRKDALRALYNLSIHPGNVGAIVEAGAVPLLFKLADDGEVAEKVLSVLSNLASTETGRKAIAKEKDAYAVLVDFLSWMDAPKCQERAAYILMMIANHSRAQRQAMVSAGAITALLELALMGTTLAQKRASRILESFREERKKRGMKKPMADQAAPQASTSSCFPDDAATAAGAGAADWTRTEEMQVVDQLVRQSLNRNMQRITKRANLQDDHRAKLDSSSERLKLLTSERSSSRSLPF